MSLLAELVKKVAIEEGFSLSGIAPAAPLRELDYFPVWIKAGFHGEMDYLAKTNDAGELRRAALANVAPWARSVVVCAANYNSATPYSTQCRAPDRGWISRYAFIESDYHDLLLARLRHVESRMVEHIVAEGHPSPRTWCYVDTGPVVERVLAQHSGIGWTGKNACILNQQLGSWLFLGVILSAHALPPDLPAADRCGSCTRCLDACPTQALVAPRQLNATRCISYLTIEQRGPVPEELREKMGRHLFGCDICQDVCPWNRRAPASPDPAFSPRTELVNPLLEWISGMNIEEFRRTFRKSPVKRAKLDGLLRNAAIAMGNSGDRRHLPRLRELAQHENPAVAEHARWAISRLETPPIADSER
ncbi:MAG: tRNA epoxyqueuosine(34) reductase QueG [Acidobacteria bacterium]|nr:MAG: tRNA epoxyqueuosine(34) reductase QueG [Acidobacteriota bacterium]